MPNKIINSELTPEERASHTVAIKDRFIFIIGGKGLNNKIPTSCNILEIDPKPCITLNDFKERNLHFLSFFNSPFLSDITLVIEDKKIFCHKLILSMYCEKFSAMFSSELKESKKFQINIKNTKFKCFELVLKHLYFFDVDKLIENGQWNLLDFLEILKLSDEYFIEDLKQWSEKQIICLINHDNFTIVNHFSKKYGAENLISYCEWYHRQNKELMTGIGLSLSDISYISNFTYITESNASDETDKLNKLNIV
jgi:hypothetical protein